MDIHIHESETVCATCRHYHQHYTKWPEYRDGYYPINYGHCAYPRIKERRPGCEACVRWEGT